MGKRSVLGEQKGDQQQGPLRLFQDSLLPFLFTSSLNILLWTRSSKIVADRAIIFKFKAYIFIINLKVNSSSFFLPAKVERFELIRLLFFIWVSIIVTRVEVPWLAQLGTHGLLVSKERVNRMLQMLVPIRTTCGAEKYKFFQH